MEAEEQQGLAGNTGHDACRRPLFQKRMRAQEVKGNRSRAHGGGRQGKGMLQKYFHYYQGPEMRGDSHGTVKIIHEGSHCPKKVGLVGSKEQGLLRKPARKAPLRTVATISRRQRSGRACREQGAGRLKRASGARL